MIVSGERGAPGPVRGVGDLAPGGRGEQAGPARRLVNGDGHVSREYGAGRGRIDVLVRWPYRDAAGKQRWQREAVEMKVRGKGDADPLREGLAQLDGYLDRIGLDTGILVIFDLRPKAAPISKRTRFEEATSPSGRALTVLRAYTAPALGPS
jgi:hypothetical protein